MSDSLRVGERRIRSYPYRGYKVIYVANTDIKHDNEIADIPLDKVVTGGHCMLAVVPEDCRDYDTLIGMESLEALEYLTEEKERFIMVFHSEALYNGVYRRISGDWDDCGYWSIMGTLPDLFEESI